MSFDCVLHFAMSSYALHPHFFPKLASGHFSRCPFRDPTLSLAPVGPLRPCFVSGRKISRNGPRFPKWPWYSIGRPPVKFRSIWKSFDAPTVNRVPRKPLLSCSPTPLQISLLAHPNPLHALGRSITIVWAKTASHLDTPSSLYLYKHPPPKFASKP